MGRLFYALRDPQGFDSRVYDQNGNNVVGWGEFCYVWKDRQIIVRLSRAERIFLTFDDPQSSYLSRIVSVVTLATIVVSSLGFILSTVPDFQDKPSDGSAPKIHPAFDAIENTCLVIFVLEYLVRLCTCWAIRDEVFNEAMLLELTTGYERIKLSTPVERLLRFIINPSNLIDLAAILPGVVTGIMAIFTGKFGDGGGGFVVLRLVRLTRIFRAFRIGKYVEPVLVIGRTVKQSTQALYVLAFNLLLGVVIFGSLMYLMEQGDWDSEKREYMRVVNHVWNATTKERQKVLDVTPFKSIPHAFWWAIVTSTTVGYGDHYPTTANGYVVAVVCMVWSLVILALPVGVIGGTFTQVWEEFNRKKKSDAEMLRREMVYVAHAIQRIQPSKVSRLLLLEVWNDDGQDVPMPASPDDFMGEVKLELELPDDAQINGRELRLPLQPNYQVVRKEVSGHITVRYDWIPSKSSTFLGPEADDENLPPQQRLLHGTLRLNVVGAIGLINTDWGRHTCSNPYVMSVCYPTSPMAEARLLPLVWRTPTAHHTLSPVWQCWRNIQYCWQVPVETTEYRSKACSQVLADGKGMASNSVQRFCESSSAATPLRSFAQAAEAPEQEDQVVSMLHQLTSSLPKLATSLAQIQTEVRDLSGRVDHLAASLRDGRHDGDGRARSGGSNGRKDPELEKLMPVNQQLEEPRGAGVGNVAAAASLPHVPLNAIPHEPG